MTYEPGLYRKARNAVYKVVLPAVAAFGIGFLAHMYLSEKQGTREGDERGVRRDGTIEEIVGPEADVIYCTEEDIKVTEELFRKTSKPK